MSSIETQSLNIKAHHAQYPEIDIINPRKIHSRLPTVCSASKIHRFEANANCIRLLAHLQQEIV